MARRSMTVADVTEILVGWDAGEGVSQLARRLGYSRPTVRKYVRAAEQVGLRRGGGRRGEAGWARLAAAALARVARPRKPSAAADELAGYRDYLAARVGTVPLAVLYQRLRDEQGLRASWRTFHRYARAQWPERARPAPRVTVRRDDPPAGEEAQVDFFYVGMWDDPEAGRRRKLYAFSLVLSHSRHQFLYPVAAENAAAWHAGHIAAFAFLGGVPRRIVLDNLTAGIARADRYDPRVNRAYGELARHYGFLVDPSRVRHPQDKPRVERNVQYARESCFRGRLDAPLAELQAHAARWCLEVAGRRVHGTTGQQPLAAFLARERARLLPLPPQPWEAVVWTTARVQADCHLRAGGAWYSVPYRHVGQRLDVRLGARVVQIYDGATLVTTHAHRASGRATRLEHYPAGGQAFLRGTPQACLERAAALGPHAAALARALLATPTLTRLREAQNLLRLAERYEPARVEAACARALAAGDGRLRTVRGILERDLDLVAAEPAPPPREARAFLRGPAAFGRPEAEEEVATW
ncbi:MAG TPA: IS21 family transposase [Thermomicrobiales bacterium]|nr:IS21 family transposase [Thermomicrobiales bacterium]